MSLLLQISDLHFGTEQPAVCDALVALAAAKRPDVVVLSGDITQRARRKQFAAARAFVDRLAPRALVAIPGNHDISLFNPIERAFFPYADFRRSFGDALEPAYESAGLVVVAIDATRRWRHVDGALSMAQVERAARRLEAADRGALKVAVVHQPVAVTDPADVTNLLHGRADAVRRLAAAGCDLWLGGHIHLPFVVDLRTRFAPLARPMWAVQAGTAVSSRTRDGVPNSVNLIEHTPGGTARCCSVERWDWRVELGAFACVLATPLALADN